MAGDVHGRRWLQNIRIILALLLKLVGLFILVWACWSAFAEMVVIIDEVTFEAPSALTAIKDPLFWWKLLLRPPLSYLSEYVLGFVLMRYGDSLASAVLPQPARPKWPPFPIGASR
jgi:hypothetical protein